jgi:8-oxo-dGTP diphosphatase
MMAISNFNIRVYGIMLRDEKILITHEFRAGLEMTKFPGGGLEKGEGIADCLKREFLEEMNLKIIIHDLVYVNDFLQVSRFNPKDQLISFYYYVSPADGYDSLDDLVNRRDLKEEDQRFEWRNLLELKEEDFTFPIDRCVITVLKSMS